MIGHSLWQRSFGGAPSVLGQTLSLSREPLTIVGVMPEGFRGLSGRAEAFVPHTMSPRISFAGYFTSEEYFHNVIATLKPGVDVDARAKRAERDRWPHGGGRAAAIG